MHIIALTSGSLNAVWTSSQRLRAASLLKWKGIDSSKKILTLYPSASNETFARSNAAGRMELRRTEGEINAIVSPLFKADGTIP